MLKLAWSLTLLALPLLSQPYGDHDQASLNAGLWPNAVPVVIDREPRRTTPARTISAELLRYPLSGKSLRMLQQALHLSEIGDHKGSVKQLNQTLAKFPDSAAYVYSLLGVEYLKTDQLAEAVEALQQSVKLLPHDASNHANLGLAFVFKGQYDRAEPELRRALDLDPHYAMASKLLSALPQQEDARK
jgi:tetratricopeptide (TPR) repeat protein